MNQRRPVSPAALTWAWLTGLALLLLGGLWLTRQLASWWDTGTWLSGSDANPMKMIRQSLDNALPWGTAHLVFGILLTLLAIGVGVLIMIWSDRRRRARQSLAYRSRRLGDGRDLSLEAATDKAKKGNLLTVAGVPAGLLLAKVMHSGRQIYLAWREGLVVIMGPGGGKTTGLGTPMILEAPGIVFGTSNKRDLADQVRGLRETRGRFWCFDPQRIANYHSGPPPWWWNLLSYVRDETRALSLAALFAGTTKGGSRKPGGEDNDFFEQSGKQLLARLLLAAAVSGRYIDQVFLWLSDEQDREPVKLLEKAGFQLPAVGLSSTYNWPPEQRSGTFATARGFVEFLENRDALTWIMPLGPSDQREQFDHVAFVRSAADTMIALSKEGDGSMGPITTALTKALLDSAEEYANEIGGRLRVPALVMLDEAANCAKIGDLPQKYSFYGGMGIALVSILQSPNQAISVWGETGWKQMWDAATIRIIGSGLKDVSLARDLAVQAGKEDVTRWNVSGGGFGGSRGFSTSSHATREDKIDPDHITNLAPGQVYIVHNNGSAPVFGVTIPYWERKGQSALVAASKEAYGPKAVA